MGSPKGLVRKPEVGERVADTSLYVILLVDIVLPVDSVKSNSVGSVISAGTVCCADSFGTRRCWQQLARPTEFIVGARSHHWC